MIPVAPRTKRPALAGWPRKRLGTDEVASHFTEDTNIGVLNGGPSGGLVDIDLDAPGAIDLAPSFLPSTDCCFGRKSKAASHWIYRTDPCPATRQYADLDGGSLVELRADGTQTVWPPSVHPSGEAVRFFADGEPACVDRDVLTRTVTHLAICSLFSRLWPTETGSRHHIANAAAGYLVRGGLDEATTIKVVESAARVAGDEEWRQRGRAASATVRTIRSGGPATGGPTLSRLLDDGATDKIGRWLAELSNHKQPRQPHFKRVSRRPKPPRNGEAVSRAKAARAYATVGLPVLPVHGIRDGHCTCGDRDCSHPGRHPCSRKDVTGASTDERQIQRWLERWPWASIGVVTGDMSGLIALEINPRENGEQLLQAMEEHHGKLPDAQSIPLRGGKFGLVFRHPGGFQRSASVGAGLQLRADRDFVIPSRKVVRHASLPLVDLDCSALPVCPAWLLDRTSEAASEGEFVSTTPICSSSGKNELEFLTLEQLRRGTGPESHVRWIVPGYLAQGTITLMAGKPKTGKSTFMFSLVASLLCGGTFLGMSVSQAAVVLLSEEDRSSLVEKTDRFELNGNIEILTRTQAYPRRSFEEVITAAVARTKVTGATVLIVDTLAFWGNLNPDEEKDAGRVVRMLDVLQEAAATGLAVLIVHHFRKAQGQETDAIRGSTALPGGVDIVVAMSRHGGTGHEKRRLLEAFSRYEATPQKLVIELADGGYRALGQPGEIVEARRQRLLQILPDGPPGLTQRELSRECGIPQQRLHELLDAVDNRIRRTGTGKKGAPYRYSRCPEFDSTATGIPKGGKIASTNMATTRPCTRCQKPLDPGWVRAACVDCGQGGYYTPLHLATEQSTYRPRREWKWVSMQNTSERTRSRKPRYHTAACNL